MGLADGLGTYPETRPYCPPEKLTIAQIQRIVEKFLQDNPAKLHHEAADLEAQALQLAFPCRQNSN